MLNGDEAISALRRALDLSPENLPLRQHLADTLLSLGRPDEAETEYRRTLASMPHDPTLKLGLAIAFYQQSKDSQALVLVEDLLKLHDTPARARLLYARLLWRTGDVAGAVRSYREAVITDSTLVDQEFADRLGIQTQPTPERTADNSVVEGKIRQSWGEESAAGPEFQPVERPSIAFADVGGMESVKDEIRMKIIHPLTHPELYRAYGKTVGGGILMYGPPGCGKTHLARATAGEIEAAFISVGIHDVLDMWIGNSERNLHQLFEQARSHRPCVLFFDEVDALGASRSDMRHSAGRQLINQFLAELDGVDSSNEGVLILAATNAPWHIDSAFRRPGRFDRILFVPPPDMPARTAILRLLCRGKPVDNIDFDHIAKKCDGFSGADLKAVVEIAVEDKLKEAMREGIPKPITTRDLTAASSGVKPSTRDWFSTARNYALYSNQGGLYDEILKYLKM